MNCKRVIVLMLVISSLLFAVSAAWAKAPIEVLYAAAKQEGQLVFSSAAPAADKFLQEFAKRYPGIKTDLIPLSAGKTTTKFMAEAAAGKSPDFDASYVTSDSIAPSLKRGLVQKVNWTDYGVPAARVRYDGRLLYWWDMVYVISYNTSQMGPADAPRSWEDLLDPKWEGKVALDPRAHGIGFYALVAGYDQARGFAEKLAKLKPIYASTSGGRLLQAVVSGEAALGFGEHLSRVLDLQRKGAPVDWVKTVKEVPAADWYLWIPKRAAHPNAAKLFTVWAATSEGILTYEELSFRAPASPENPSKQAQMLKKLGITPVFKSSSLADIEVHAKFVREMTKVLGAMK